MHNKNKKITHLFSAITLIYAIHPPAYADDEKNSPIEEVMITASRLKTTGYEAPTPVTMLRVNDMESRGTTDIAELINEVPSFSPTLTTSTTVLNSRQNGVSGLDLRGLGPNRNLVLVNGRRHVPFDENGIVNVAAIPAVVIKQVDIVTGGASAAWGTDAVSGVVNIIFDDELEGGKIDIQGGQTAEGDGENMRVSAAFGQKFAEGRGHLMVAADVVDNDGVLKNSDRDWGNKRWGLLRNPADTGPADGIPRFYLTPDTTLFYATPGGVTLPGASAVSNLEFLSNGTAIPRELGIYGGGSHMVGGSGSELAARTALDIPVEREAFLGSIRYDITDTLRVFAEGSHTSSETYGPLIDAFRIGNIPIKSGNPYLPADVQATMDGNAITGFNLSKTFEDFDPIASDSKNTNKRLVLGLEGEFDNNGWWEAYYQYGKAEFINDQPFNLLPANLNLAVDAVVDPSTGEIVCAANVGGANGAPGCAPANVFGKGNLSQAAIDYITDTGGSVTDLDQDVYSISGGVDIFQGWAGPISTAFGVEHRKESLSRTVSENDDNFKFIIVNAQPLNGEMDVTEVFNEWGVPLISGKQRLDLNAAVRWADYSSVGNAISWKSGLVYQPLESITVRGTVSQDIRAPSIGEQFLEATLLFANVVNRFTGLTDSIERLNTGNKSLSQEEAKTKTVGVVWSPTDTNLQLSVDWYDISLTDAIGSPTPQQIVDRCAAGEAAICDLIEFDDESGKITRLTNPLLNLGSYDIEGIDLSADYDVEVGAGTLGITFLTSYLLNKEIDASGSNPVNVIDSLGFNDSIFGAPEMKARLGLSYDSGPWGVYTQLRYTSAGKYDPKWGPEEISASDNNIPSVTYIDVSGYYRLNVKGMEKLELYGGVTNLGDKDPPIIPRDFISNVSANPQHHDVLGQRFYLGLRMAF
ncbi:MAG: TonB-dependent receptor [Porticoccaceae bacterium]|nr:TonB-dependent receptor [Porticoccaceae bacterium]